MPNSNELIVDDKKLMLEVVKVEPKSYRDMGKEIKKITAKEARKIADESEFTLKHIYKVIRERAEENGTSTEWCTYDLSKAALITVKAYLKDDGFDVKVNDKEFRLIIKW